MWPAATASLWLRQRVRPGADRPYLQGTAPEAPDGDCARLLRRSDWNIQQIITYVGYENTSYFYRLFHERYGQSPREYRQSRAARTRTPA